MTTTTGAAVRSVARDGAGAWQVRAGAGGTDLHLRAPRLVLATPLDAWAELPFDGEVARHLEAVDIPDHPPLSTLVLGFERRQIGHPLDGFGVLFPRLEKRFCLGAIFSSTLFPGRAPDGRVALMCFIGGVQQPANAELPTPALVDRTVQDLRPLLGISGEPVFSQHAFWPRAIPQYNVGHGAFIESLERIEQAFPGLHLRGNFRGGPGLNDCLEGALHFGAAAS